MKDETPPNAQVESSPEAGGPLAARLLDILSRSADPVSEVARALCEEAGLPDDAALRASIERVAASVGVALTLAADRKTMAVNADLVRHAEQKFTRAFETVSDAMILAEVETGRLLDVNPAFTKLFGYSRLEAVGRTTVDLGMWLSAEGRAAFRQLFRETGQVHRYEARMGDSTGREFWAAISATPIELDGVPALVGLVRDIDDRKTRHLELQRTMLLLGQAQRLASVGAWEYDVKSRHAHWTDENFKIHDTTREDHIPTVENFADFYPAESVNEIRAAFDRGMEDGAPWDLELPMTTKKGRKLWVRLVGQPILDEGVVVKVVGALQDLTLRKAEAEERERIKAEVHQLQKMESIGTLAGGIAHDFNNLLTGLLGGLSLMDLKHAASPSAHEEIQELIALVHRGADLTKQLLGFARRGRYNVKPINLNAVVSETSRLFARTRKDVDVRLVLTPQKATVLADATQMEQVLLNLLVNAGQAMPRGGACYVSTTLSTLEPTEAAELGGMPGSFVLLEVKDTGVGMSAETRDRVFEPFFTTKPAGQGTGLGLASVYGIVHGHGGFLRVDSAPGLGASFRVYLPSSDEVPEDVRPRSVPARKPGTGTVLVVDDEEPILAALQKMLVSLGYDVRTASGGSEAVRVLKEQGDVALVILDMIMPNMSGLETFERLREVRPDVRVLLATGYSLEGQSLEVMRRGCCGLLQKPFSLETLAAKLQEVL